MPAIDWSHTTATIARAERDGTGVGTAVVAASGQRFVHNADRRFVAASTVKIPIMIELYRQIDAGRHTLSETYTFRAEDRAPGSGVMLHLHDGMVFTLGDLAYLMISISDNSATNILIDMLGMDAVNATMQRLGMKRSVLGRKMRGHTIPGDAGENWATPNDYATVIAALLGNTAAAPDSCRQMVAMLEKQQNQRRIARHLPRENGPRWGSKTGSVPGVTNDVGFIETASGPLILAVFCEHADPHWGEQLIGEISRAALQAVQ